MDDLLLFTPSKETDMSKLEDLLKALLKNGVKISPKKCQLFETSLQYMGNEIFIENKKVYVKPLRNRKYCEAIMDDLLLFTPSKETDMSKLEDLLKALLKNGVKISPKKCQLFETSLQYMGNEIFIENKKVYVKPLRNRFGFSTGQGHIFSPGKL